MADRFPTMAAMLREMSPEGRQLIAQWHIVMSAGLKTFADKYNRDWVLHGMTPLERIAGKAALEAWLEVMHAVGGTIADEALPPTGSRDDS